MKIFLKNARIIDGTGSKSYTGSILIHDDRIETILTTSETEQTFSELETSVDKVIDCSHYVCAPGFIDTHSHSDLELFAHPELQPKLMQGVTTEILGQDGISMAPLPVQYISAWKKNLAGLDGTNDSLDWTYQTTDNYLSMIGKAKPALNEMYLVPHGNVRMEAMGLENRPATSAEIEKMCRILHRELEAGACGLSSGLIYIPCTYAQTEELIELCKVLKEFNKPFVVHQRSEADTIISSMQEIIRIGRESGAPIHFSHFKVCGKGNWKYLPEMLELLDEAEKEGIRVSMDQYPYIAGSTMLGVILPPWVHAGGTDVMIARLQDDENRKKIKKDITRGIPGWDNFIDFAGTEGIYITSVVSAKNQDCVGLNLEQLGEKRNKDALDAAFDLLAEEKNAVGMVDFYGTEDHVKQIIQRPETNVCTDGLLGGKPHPRVYGAFPRVLGKYCREENCFSLETAVRKMTGRPADVFEIKERGYIREGYYADLCLFSSSTIIDKGTFTEPEQFPEGIEYVLVNGSIEVENGKTKVKNRSGKVIRS